MNEMSADQPVVVGDEPKRECRHCFQARPQVRGLCADCFADPMTRRQYPTDELQAEEPEYLFRKNPRKDRSERPTFWMPGTPGKVAIMADRWRKGHPLFVDGDRKRDEDRRAPLRHGMIHSKVKRSVRSIRPPDYIREAEREAERERQRLANQNGEQ